MNTLAICKATRHIAAETLKSSLEKLLSSNHPISEVDLRDAWLLELRKRSELFPDGWYDPPPHGIAVLFGTEKNPHRLDFKSLRKEENCSCEDIYLDKKSGLVFLYAGPINKEGIIGDIELSLYFGKKPEIQEYLTLHYNLIKKIFAYVSLGATFKNLFDYSEELFKKHGFVNAIVSITDPTNTNIGHSIPFIDKPITEEEKRTLHGVEWETACKMVSNKRIFLNKTNQTVVKPNMAFTIEPGVKIKEREDMPFIAFHTTVLIHENGEKELLTGFDEIFKLAGMDYMLE